MGNVPLAGFEGGLTKPLTVNSFIYASSSK
jgi:hypothetical protein